MADSETIIKPLLDQPDSAFGWSGISFMFPRPWQFLLAELDSLFDRQIEKIYGPQG